MSTEEALRWARGVNSRIPYNPILSDVNHKLYAMLDAVQDFEVTLCTIMTAYPSIERDLGQAYESLRQAEKHLLGASCDASLDALGIARIKRE